MISVFIFIFIYLFMAHLDKRTISNDQRNCIEVCLYLVIDLRFKYIKK